MLLELVGYEEVLLDDSVAHGFTAMWKVTEGLYWIIEHPLSGCEKPHLIQSYEHPARAAEFWFAFTGCEASCLAAEIAAYRGES